MFQTFSLRHFSQKEIALCCHYKTHRGGQPCGWSLRLGVFNQCLRREEKVELSLDLAEWNTEELNPVPESPIFLHLRVTLSPTTRTSGVSIRMHKSGQKPRATGNRSLQYWELELYLHQQSEMQTRGHPKIHVTQRSTSLSGLLGWEWPFHSLFKQNSK